MPPKACYDYEAQLGQRFLGMTMSVFRTLLCRALVKKSSWDPGPWDSVCDPGLIQLPRRKILNILVVDPIISVVRHIAGSARV